MLIVSWHGYECESKYNSTHLGLLKVEIGRQTASILNHGVQRCVERGLLLSHIMQSLYKYTRITKKQEIIARAGHAPDNHAC